MDFLDSRSTRELTLTFENAVDPLLATPPSQRVFGAGAEPELKKGAVRLRIGERPMVRDLKLLYAKAGKRLSADLEVFSAYNIWLIGFGVGILKESGFGRVNRFGFAVTFADKPRVTVVDLFPKTKFVKKVGAELRAEMGLGVNGSAAVPEAVTQMLTETEVLSADASIQLSAGASFVGKLAFSVLTPIIEAIGVGGRHAEWVFEKSEQPLLGDQMMAITLLAPKPAEELETTIRLSAAVSTFNLLPFNMETTIDMRVPLGNEEEA